MSTYTTLTVERPDRPDRLNAITFEMFDEFVTLQAEAKADRDARVLVVTGTGRALIAAVNGAAAGAAVMFVRNSPVAMALTKQVLRGNVDAPPLEAALALQNRNQVLATRTEDMVEAPTAFSERRKPTDVGH